MFDDEELGRLIRSADPATTPLDSPLDVRALVDLGRITGAVPRDPVESVWRNRRTWIALPSAVALLLVIVLVLQGWNLFGSHTATKAVAATPPLLTATPSPYTFGEVMHRAMDQLRSTTGPAESRRASYATWNLNVDADFKDSPSSFISTEDVTLTWSPDLSGTLVRTVGKTIATDTAPGDGGALPPQEGTLLSSQTYSAGELGVLNQGAPPTDSASMLEYLQLVAGEGNDDPVDLLDAVTSLLNEWTLTSQQESAVLSALRHVDGFTTYGEVTDRLGRPGIALLAKSPTNTSFESLLILSPTTGRILSVETIYLGGVQDLRDLHAPAVVNYTAWRD